MKTRIALFRGINVVGRNTLPMKELVALLGELGCKDVRTYIQSGNAVFRTVADSAGLGRRITAEIGRQFGFEPQVLILDPRDVAAIAAANPYPAATKNPKSLHVYFLAARPANPDLAALEAARTPSESFQLRDRAFYLHAPDGIGRSKLAARVETAMGVPATARNWRTVCQLLEWVG
ncbi:MAG: DUF1697 domain-containing protein [Woeseiaceae bacterium]|nr:DUF1697 domain-containing protein [Woeseiaceae bacterium]